MSNYMVPKLGENGSVGGQTVDFKRSNFVFK
jgi:hypothetical protein